MRKISMLMVMLLIVVGLSAEWSVHTVQNEMDGVVGHVAASDKTPPTKVMQFPYNIVWARVNVSRRLDSGSIMVSLSFNLENILGFEQVGDYLLGEIRVKWDNGKIETAQVWSHDQPELVIFSDTDAVLNKLKKSKSLLIELEWYNEGEVYFRFDLTGAAAAIKKIGG